MPPEGTPEWDDYEAYITSELALEDWNEDAIQQHTDESKAFQQAFPTPLTSAQWCKLLQSLQAIQSAASAGGGATQMHSLGSACMEIISRGDDTDADEKIREELLCLLDYEDWTRLVRWLGRAHTNNVRVVDPIDEMSLRELYPQY